MAVEKLKLVAKVASSFPTMVDDCYQAYERELDYLFGVLRRLGVPSRDVEDVMHEVFLAMHQGWESYDRVRPLRPWLFGIAFRVASAQRRKGQREVLGILPETEDPRPPPDDAAAASELRDLLLKAMAGVPLDRRAVLLMHDLDETPMREIAAELRIPLFTVYSRLRKARKELDAALTRLQKRGQL